MIKYIKSVLWKIAKCLSYIEEARSLKVKTCRIALGLSRGVKNRLRGGYLVLWGTRWQGGGEFQLEGLHDFYTKIIAGSSEREWDGRRM